MNMKRILQVILILNLITRSVVAQSNGSEYNSVIQTLEKLFTGMQKGDSTMVRETFTQEITLATLGINTEGQTKIFRENSLEGFLHAVGTPHKDAWYEEYWNLKVQIADGLAAVWCDYAFYLGNTFSHCGVDAFHLIKEKNGWKIFHLADTRKKEGCNVPRNIQDRHKK
jgi:hypothetical protein